MQAKQMKLKEKVLVLIFLFIPAYLFPQFYSVTGVLVDQNDSIIPAASVLLLQQADSAFVKGTISANNGAFALDNVKTGHYLMAVQHLLYNELYTPMHVAGPIELGNISLNERTNELGEVNIKAVRPVVKMKDNVISYDMTAISEKFVRNSALEVLGDVPGLLLKDNQVQLVGASQLNIAINGKPTTMSMSQVLKMLEIMPVNSVKEIQVMYASPAKYHVKGSLINIVLKEVADDQLNGVLSAGFKQRKYAGGNGGVNLQYAKGKWETGFMINSDYTHSANGYEIDINHLYRDTLYTIEQDMHFPSKRYTNNLQFSTTFQLNEHHQVSLLYNGSFENSDREHNTEAIFGSVKGISQETDKITGDSEEQLHNLKLDYESGSGLNAGIDFTNYHEPSKENYQSTIDGTTTLYRTVSSQTVDKWMGYFDHSLELGNDWSVNYGSTYSYVNNDNYFRYYSHNNTYFQEAQKSSSSSFSESTVSVFAGLSGSISSKLSFEASLKGEYDKMVKDTLGSAIDLWTNFRVYPGLNLTYLVDNSGVHMLQLALQSYANYPTYWEVSPATWYTNQYMLLKGNPELQPSQTYESSLNYIFKRKYVLVLSYEHTSEMISQIPLASEETFNTIARTENLDYETLLTTTLVLPFSVGSRVDFNPTIGGFRRIMKGENAENQSFHRSGNTFFIQLNQAILLRKKNNVKLNLSGYYYNKMIQTIYNIDDFYDVSLGLSCALLKDKGTLTLRVKDIFDSNSPRTRINFYNQQSRYHPDMDSRMLTFDFKYHFGKPLKDKKVNVDKSRFERMN
jgi:hypothetical protein